MTPTGAAAKEAGERIMKLLSSWGFWAVIFVVGFAVYFYLKGRKKGKEAATQAIKEDLIVTVDTKLVTTGGKTWDPAPLTDTLYADIYSSWVTPRNKEPYELLLAINDEKFKMVHNDWLKRFFDKDQETLKVAISNEQTSIGDGGTFGKLRNSILARFTNLKLE